MDDNLPPNSTSPTQPQAQPTNVPTEEQSLAPEAPKKSKLPFVLIGLLILGLLLLVGYLAYQNYQLRQELGKLPTVPSTSDCEYKGKTYASGESFKDDCNSCSCGSNGEVACTTMGCLSDDPSNVPAGWKQYDAEEYLLSFAYPPDFIVRKDEAWIDEIGGETKITGYTVVWGGEEVLDRRWMYIKRIEPGSVEEETIQPFLKLDIGETYINPNLLPTPYTRKQDLIMGDNVAMVFEAPGEWEIQGAVKKVLVQSDGEYYEAFMTYSNYEDRDIDYPSTFDQILSTFEFTGSASIQCQGDEDCSADHFCDTDIVCPKGTSECSKTGTNLCVSECVTDSDCQSPLVCKEYYYFSGSDVAGTTKLGCTDPLTE